MAVDQISLARRYHLSDIPKRSAQRFKEKLAIVDGDMALSFTEFYQATERLAAYFATLHLIAGDRLILLTRNCWQCPVISFAAARLGVVTVPVNFMLNAQELSYIVAHSQAKIVCVEDQLTAVFDEACRLSTHHVESFHFINLNAHAPTGVHWQDLNIFQQCHAQIPEYDLDASQAIRLMYTSGTESKPKGVLLNSEALMWQYMSSILEGQMQSQDREIHAFPLYHCAQLDAFLNVDLYLGATSYILRGFDPDTVLKTIETHKINKLFCPPTAWIALLNHPNFERTDLSSLNKAYYGASAMPQKVISSLLEKLPHIRFWQFYGQTEMAPIATVLYPEDHIEHAQSVGRPVMHVQTQIMNEDGQLLAAGELGEIVHRSVHLMQGYANDPHKTSEAFAHGWFHSGDLGYLDQDGYLYVVDRIKDLIKTGGENVASREVEECLYRLAAIKEVAVFGVPHPHWIEAITAVYILHEGKTLSHEEIIQHCKQYLAQYKIPKYSFSVNELPKNASGKILKRQLRDAYHSTASSRTA